MDFSGRSTFSQFQIPKSKCQMNSKVQIAEFKRVLLDLTFRHLDFI